MRFYRIYSGRYRRVPREQDGLPGIGDRQRRAEKLLLAALPANGDSARSRTFRDTRHRVTESRERTNPRTFRGKFLSPRFSIDLKCYLNLLINELAHFANERRDVGELLHNFFLICIIFVFVSHVSLFSSIHSSVMFIARYIIFLYIYSKEASLLLEHLHKSLESQTDRDCWCKCLFIVGWSVETNRTDDY